MLARFWLIGCLILAGYIAAPAVQNMLLDAQGPRTWTKPIEEVQAGEWVLAAHEDDPSRIAPRPVRQVFRRTSDHLRYLTFRDSSGNEQNLETTNEHPFWVEGKGWIEAGSLEIGDTSRDPDGNALTLIATRYEAHPDGIAVYNFEVDGHHTYFVAAPDARGPPVLVHNASKDYQNYSDQFPQDFQDKATRQHHWHYQSEGEARHVARTKVGHNPVHLPDNKLRSRCGQWQYRAKSQDLLGHEGGKGHVHLERLDPTTGRVIENHHLYFPARSHQ